MRQLLDQHRVIICCGSGGVGKTTTSAALGVLAAKAGKRVLVLTIDPARRLATTLGTSGQKGAVRVPGQNYSGELFAATLDPEAIFARFIRRAASNEAMAQRLFDNPLYQQLSTTLSGSQEFTSLVELHDYAASGDYDLVILDTPPSAHAAQFLLAPQRLNAVFDSQVMNLMTGKLPGLGLAARALKYGVNTVLGALRVITGAEFIRQIQDFFVCIDGLAPAIRDNNQRAEALLRAAGTGFVLVSSLDRAHMAEGERFATLLQGSGYVLKQVIINRCWPSFIDSQVLAGERELASSNHSAAQQQLYNQMTRYYLQRQQLPQPFAAPLWLPEFDRDVYGLQALELIAQRMVAD